MTKRLKYSICEDSGFLHASAICARNGIQEYYGYEIGLDGEMANEVFNVFRPLDEVTNSLSTFTNAVVTDEHPTDGIVTTSTSAELAKGSVSEAELIELDGVSYVVAQATVTDKTLIDQILSGEKVELSAGYTRDIVKESGVYDGVSYDYVQKNIRVNHLAVVKEGRCGNTCKLNLDTKGVPQMVNIQIDGKKVSMDEAEVASYVKELQASKDEAVTEMEEAKKTANDAEASKEELAQSISEKEVELEALKSQLESMVSPEEAEMMVEEAMEIEEDAEALGMELKEKSNDAKRREILGSITKGKVNLDSIDKVALKAVYRISVDSAVEAKKVQTDGYKGTEAKGVVTRTGNLTNDLNAIAAQARKNRGVK